MLFDVPLVKHKVISSYLIRVVDLLLGWSLSGVFPRLLLSNIDITIAYLFDWWIRRQGISTMLSWNCYKLYNRT
jgi:hypothetical protein